MSVPGLSGRGGLGLIPEAALPAAVRNSSTKDKEAYKAALGFEQVLLGQLVKSMASDGPLSEGPYATPVQDALSCGLIDNGGLGLAGDIYKTLKERA